MIIKDGSFYKNVEIFLPCTLLWKKIFYLVKCGKIFQNINGLFLYLSASIQNVVYNVRTGKTKKLQPEDVQKIFDN